MAKKIYCEKCEAPINNKEDLVTATVFYEIYPFHSGCYVTDIKGPKTLILGNHPINGFASNFKVISLSIIAILWAIFADQSIKWASFIAIPIIIYRLYSYLKFERHME